LVIQSVIENNTNGQVFVDDPTNPKGALLWNCAEELLLEGTPFDTRFNQSLAGVLTKRIIPNACARHIPMLSLQYFPDAWENTIESTILKYLHPEKAFRNLYWFRALLVDWRRKIPPKFTMRRIDAELLEQTELKNYQDMCLWINSFWHSQSDFLAKGAGFCLMEGNSIISWCLSVYAGAQNFELGLATSPLHRNRGYATLTSAACVEYCLDQQIVPHWHCLKSNLASIAVAEKVGFEKVMEYPVYRFQTLLSDMSM
ncbi:MAG TPA: GNAT family N-acetyltransferase, partial [Levilinea sp.]|nr:GNAT family N-acetyltransferase [Levilinea sp.]